MNRLLGAGLAGLFSVASLLAQTPSAPSSAEAPAASPSPDATNRRAQHRQRMLQKFDTNGDGKIDANERAAMKQAKAARVKQYDTNGDGKLDANEKAAMKSDLKAKRKALRNGAGQPAAQPSPTP